MTYRREHDSKGEKAFIKKYLKSFNPIMNKTGEIIAYSFEVKKKSKNKILWSCHIDTMHRSDPNTIKQNVYVDQFDVAFVDDKDDCLDAVVDPTSVYRLSEDDDHEDRLDDGNDYRTKEDVRYRLQEFLVDVGLLCDSRHRLRKHCGYDTLRNCRHERLLSYPSQTE
jgi:hypothetical protein